MKRHIYSFLKVKVKKFFIWRCECSLVISHIFMFCYLHKLHSDFLNLGICFMRYYKVIKKICKFILCVFRPTEANRTEGKVILFIWTNVGI